MRIISYNVNGIRAAIKKGFAEWMQTHPADIICIQESKAQQADVARELFTDLGYEDHWFCARKKGYSGVTIFTKIPPDHIQCGTGHQVSDEEGRVMHMDFGPVRIVNAYFPSGTMGQERQNFKYQWLDEFFGYLQDMRKTKPHIILCGDYNIAHREIDIHNPAGNRKNTGFLPEERAWMDKFFDHGWVDTFRIFHPEPHRYTWWSQLLPSVRLSNKGWRIDYISVTDTLTPYLKDAEIFPDIKHSDHCPVYLEIETEKIPA